MCWRSSRNLESSSVPLRVTSSWAVIRRVYERLGLPSGFPEGQLSPAASRPSVKPSESSHVGLSAPPARRRRRGGARRMARRWSTSRSGQGRGRGSSPRARRGRLGPQPQRLDRRRSTSAGRGRSGRREALAWQENRECLNRPSPRARQCSIPRSCRHSGVLSSRRHRVLRSCRHSALWAPFSDNFGGHAPSRPTVTRDDDNFGGSAQGRRSSKERLIPLVL